MRKYLILLAALAALLGFGPSPASAIPSLGGGGIAEQLKDNGVVQQARWYCYNRYSGRFLHWGRCGGRHYWHRRHYRHYWRRWHRPHYRYYIIRRYYW